jgi:hypothetical protein
MMKNCKRYHLLAIMVFGLCIPSTIFAGNPDRAGSAGGLQLLINPWVRSAAFSGANMADGSPVESMFLNVAGMAFVEQTEVAFTHTNYLSGADVGINTGGLVQRIGETSVLGVSVSAVDFGDIRRTTTETPDGDGTFFNVNMVNIGVSYAKAFSNSIYGGITLKVINESVADLSASGVAFDAGIKYVTGERDQVKFGITLKNVGPPLSFSGDGLSFQSQAPGNFYEFTAELRSANYELPSLVSIGVSYDFLLGENHFLTAHGAFIANSFSNDNYLLGLEYSFSRLFYLRAGYHYEENIWDDDARRFVYTGLSAGAGVEFEFGDRGSRISVDYAYRVTQPFNGTHSIGARIHLGRPE